AKNRPARAKSGSKATPGRRHDAAIRAAERVVQTFLKLPHISTYPTFIGSSTICLPCTCRRV
ncbi:hypothetical protein, partial [Ralstonia mannitolilytica]|uniref:hypothetical protein n=1 Tax=Ralstonia mannitolilytica TaxID=105219 RepID=UPI00292F0ED6